jgi:glutamate carboxypeptidase
MEPDISTYVTAQKADMFALLERMVLIQSGSYNKVGVDEMARLIGRTCASMPLSVRTVAQKTLGNHVVVRSTANAGAGGAILLVGHMDTVFPANTAFNWYKEDDLNCYGPGVCDMKGGLVVGIYAVQALAACGLLERVPVTFVFNSDEEIGSPGSRDLIREHARACCAAFVLECGGRVGEIVTGRKGNLSQRLVVKGKSGHAAFAGKDKASAILELAYKIVALERLNDSDAGMTVNVGKIDGGIGSNTVAEEAYANVDCRFITQDQQKEMERKITDITSKSNVPGTRGIVETLSRRPPMPRSEKNAILYDIVRTVGSALNQTIGDEYRQGVSDANLIAAEDIPVVDGLGPMGGRDHSDKEFMVKESLIQRTILLANAIVSAHRHFAR